MVSTKTCCRQKPIVNKTIVKQTIAEQTIAEQTIAEQTIAEQTIAEQKLPQPYFDSCGSFFLQLYSIIAIVHFL